MRTLIAALSVTFLSACAVSESDRFMYQMDRAERFEKTAMEREACEADTRGAWMCTSSSERASERYPWLYCSCVQNQTVLD